MILGDPGAGKSTLAKWLSYRIAADDRPRVPFLVILRDLSEALRAGERTLEEYLPGVARTPYNIPFLPEAVEYLLLNGRAVVLLDGLDELTDLSLRQRVVDLVDGFAALHPLVPIVVTSRSIGYTDAPLRWPAFQTTTTIAAFSDDQVKAYARNWFDLDDGTAPHERAGLCEAFLRDSATIHELRSNPMLLALLCAMYRTERYIPGNRAEVYERCAVTLFEFLRRWAAGEFSVLG
ncbi:MAG TPA: NACHT domain-containing protein [Candidatus Limnocylindrales bacterium]|nr:NACHT domain-containing protein [Candidatus Limnocylindrales bacterium]